VLLSLLGATLLACTALLFWPAQRELATARVLGARESPVLAGHWDLLTTHSPFPTHGTDGDASITLAVVANGFSLPTDIQFVPGSDTDAVVLEKHGTAKWLRLPEGKHGTLFKIDVATASEQGLLGAVFHPRFADNGKLYVNYVVPANKRGKTRIAEWTLSIPSDLAHTKAAETKILLEVEQPYANHNAGQLAFGPDGMLYIGFGDGGSANDPQEHAQNPRSLLGKMLRIDVDKPDASQPYGIPRDNPFLGDARFKPEIWAYGLRNPWRYSFDPKARLIVADVGQDAWEEIAIVQAGDNHGWHIREGFVCARAADSCSSAGMVDPIYAYPHKNREQSITGGYVYLGRSLPKLHGKYIFGDFAAGTVYALTLPAERKQRGTAERIGKWPIAPSTFGRDASGEVYVADFAGGTVFRLTSMSPPTTPAP
jgi:glucose/arabinose dehydrogenase